MTRLRRAAAAALFLLASAQAATAAPGPAATGTPAPRLTRSVLRGVPAVDLAPGSAQAAAACANPYCLTGSVWSTASLPVHYRVNANTADVSDELSHVVAAAGRWEDEPNSIMDWTYDGTTTSVGLNVDGVSTIYWSASRTIADCGGAANYIACTQWSETFDPVANRWFISEFDVEMYDGVAWSTNGSTSYDVQTTMIHELGHALGLDHTSYPGQRMNDPLSDPFEHALGSGDAAGVRHLYPAPCVDWCLRHSNSSGAADVVFTYGADTDVPVVGDWDGNGTTTPGIVRTVAGQLEWHLRNGNSSGSANVTFVYGMLGDVPVVGDWDGNGTSTPGIVRGRAWHLRNSNSSGGASITPFEYGAVTDSFITGDWDGNSTTTIGVWRAGDWHLRNSNSGGGASLTFGYGLASDTPVVGDWDGNRTDTVGITRTNEWHLRNSNSGGSPSIAAFGFGATSDVKLTGDWDGNGTATPGVRR